MATYVISDLHGEYERLTKLMQLIDFSDEDQMYVIGDVVDRGKEGVRILTEIMRRPNMHMLLGNHEYMCLRYFALDATEKEKRHWNRNGNYHTLNGFDALTEEERANVLSFIRELPDSATLLVNGRKFVLIHGFTGENTYRRVWNRPVIGQENGLDGDVTLIIGHTPVVEYVKPDNDEEAYAYSKELTARGEHFRILHDAHFIDIDCCCGYGFSAGRLGCLRLDDMAEFYA